MTANPEPQGRDTTGNGGTVANYRTCAQSKRGVLYSAPISFAMWNVNPRKPEFWGVQKKSEIIFIFDYFKLLVFGI